MELAVEGMLMNGHYEEPVWDWWGFYIEALTSGSTVKMAKTGSPPAVTLEYSTNGGKTWSSFNVDGNTIITLRKGKRVCFRSGSNGNTRFASSTSAYRRFVFTGSVSIGGNIMSLLSQTEITEFLGSTSYQFAYLFYQAASLKDTSALFLPATTLANYCYRYMFSSCTSLTTTPVLPATTLAQGCYYSMFSGCKSLTTAPVLHATTLAANCYHNMFSSCTSLEFAPALPATTLANYCYYQMFWNCSSLTSAPALPATTLKDYCYAYMFQNCSSLTTTPVLPATTLAQGCYQYMFQGCTSLITAPVLPATTLKDNCYDCMFSGCKSLTTAPVLPATTLATYCYKYMFSGCTSLTSAPALPATTLKDYCYAYMFQNCSSLTSAPALPATTLASYCYQYMFQGCTSLITAPVLPATTLTSSCYQNMFSGCTKLSFIKTNQISFIGCTNWVQGVASSGTFICPSILGTSSTIQRGVSACPQNWNVADHSQLGFYVQAEEAGATIAMNSGHGGLSFEYSTDCASTWSSFVPGTTTVTLANAKDIVCIRAGSSINTSVPKFVFTKNVSVHGKITCLLDQSGPSELPIGSGFGGTFFECTTLTDASDLIFPVNSLEYCYVEMFSGCTSLVNAPALPATTLAESCYQAMFSGCTSLVNAPALPATTLAESCYQAMFSGCTSLVNAPALPATTLASTCYYLMFSGCTSLVNAPALPATTLVGRCYESMFQNCSNLRFIKTNQTSFFELFSSCGDWVAGVTSSGTFICPAALGTPATIQRGDSACPTNWNVSNWWGFYVRAEEAGSTVKMMKTGSSPTVALEYSTDIGSTWSSFNVDGGTTITLANAGDLVFFRSGSSGNTRFALSTSAYRRFVFTGSVSIGGNIMSLLSQTEITEFPGSTSYQYQFAYLFYQAASLKDTSALFLPATTLKGYCYYNMFLGCISLTSAPALPATTLAQDCYYGMFYGCTSLTPAPVLPATTLATYCYQLMFLGCKSLTSAPALPATTLASSCYSSMFSGCTSLTVAPALPATTLASSCYSSMFQGCTFLTTAPALPATTLASSCYSSMFQGCTFLTTAPALPVMTLTSYCYSNMFQNCISLASAPALPATTLANNCYNSMFRGCSSLVFAPILPATTLVENCYYYMFYGCETLNFIKTNQTSFDGCSNWVNGVASSGAFVCPTALGTSSTIQRGVSACPQNWNVSNWWGFYVRAEEAGSTVSMAKIGSPPVVTLEYSTDLGSTWSSFNVDGGTTVTLTNVGDLVFFRSGSGGNIHFTINYKGEDFRKFVFTDSVSIGGNIMSLLSQTEITEFPSNDTYQFGYLFSNAATLKDALALSLPATVLKSGCYSYMFSGCSSLINAPALPATTLAAKCYFFMFEYCYSLVNAPSLPATMLISECYNGMFTRCTSLATAPALPATTLASSCYSYMFSGCSSLINSPALPATILAIGCYSYMFRDCTSLATAPALPAATLASNCYSYMFRGCTSLTTAPALPATTLAGNCYYYMFDGCTSLTTAPALPATTLASNCYGSMFIGCSKLSFIKTNQTTFDNCTNWVQGVAASGTFICQASLGTSATIQRGVSACPQNWNVSNWWGFYVRAEEAGSTVSMAKVGSPQNVTLEYSIDLGSTWSSFDIDGGTTITLANAGDLVFFRSGSGGNTHFASSAANYRKFVFTDSVSIGGNIMSLLSQTEITEFSGSASFQFTCLFYQATYLKEASALSLPATTLAYGCYSSMFQDCTSLAFAPVIPATTLANNCYSSMFSGCTSLTTAPALPATTLVDNCYYNMFQNCTSLTSAPALPATTLANYCYYSMFQGCTSLTSAPALPATTLAQDCYYNMFYSCTSLTTAPALPATTLANYCYYSMFQGCTSLTSAPALPATTLANYCYSNMFRGCTSFTSAPALPATTLANYCYYNMFYSCTSLTSAPVLPASDTSFLNCYYWMFSSCSKLNYIKTNQSSFSNCGNWVYGVSAQGTFDCISSLGTQDSITRGTSACPTNWTVVNHEDPGKTVFTFTDGTTSSFNWSGELTLQDMIDAELKTNSYAWTRSDISSIMIGTNVTKLGDRVFSEPGQQSTISISLPNSLSSIGNFVFVDCGIGDLYIPESVVEIGSSLFGSYSPASITVAYNANTVIGPGAFYGLTSYITFEGRTKSEVQSMANYDWAIASTTVTSPNVALIYCTDGTIEIVQTPCLVKGTRILMADGTAKKIEDIQYGDILKAWDFDEGKLVNSPVFWLMKQRKPAGHFYEMHLSNGAVLKTTGTKANHRVFNTDKQMFVGVAQTKAGDHVWSIDGIVEVEDVKLVNEEVEYYNLMTAKTLNCFAEGLLTSNRYSNIYKMQDMKYVKDSRKVRPYSEFEAAGISRYFYDNMRLGEVDLEQEPIKNTKEYVNRLESLMQPLPKQ